MYFNRQKLLLFKNYAYRGCDMSTGVTYPWDAFSYLERVPQLILYVFFCQFLRIDYHENLHK